MLKNERINLEDCIISFDVVSLLTKMPPNKAIQVIRDVADPEMAMLVEVCLRSTFFSFRGEYYEQSGGVAMGSPSLLLLQTCIWKNLKSYPSTPTTWNKKFGKDLLMIRVVWQHGKEELTRFLNHLNNISKDIQFTMEIEENGWIPFLDILIIRKLDGYLDHKVFRKKTHIENYLHAYSHLFPAQKIGVIKTLATTAFRIHGFP